VVNTASRLEGFVKRMRGPCDIIAGTAVVLQAHPAIAARYVGPIALHGATAKPTMVSQILGIARLSSDDSAFLHTVSTPLRRRAAAALAATSVAAGITPVPNAAGKERVCWAAVGVSPPFDDATSASVFTTTNPLAGPPVPPLLAPADAALLHERPHPAAQSYDDSYSFSGSMQMGCGVGVFGVGVPAAAPSHLLGVAPPLPPHYQPQDAAVAVEVPSQQQHLSSRQENFSGQGSRSMSPPLPRKGSLASSATSATGTGDREAEAAFDRAVQAFAATRLGVLCDGCGDTKFGLGGIGSGAIGLPVLQTLRRYNGTVRAYHRAVVVVANGGNLQQQQQPVVNQNNGSLLLSPASAANAVELLRKDVYTLYAALPDALRQRFDPWDSLDRTLAVAP
jgi:hypothetical protein